MGLAVGAWRFSPAPRGYVHLRFSFLIINQINERRNKPHTPRQENCHPRQLWLWNTKELQVQVVQVPAASRGVWVRLKKIKRRRSLPYHSSFPGAQRPPPPSSQEGLPIYRKIWLSIRRPCILFDTPSPLYFFFKDRGMNAKLGRVVFFSSCAALDCAKVLETTRVEAPPR